MITATGWNSRIRYACIALGFGAVLSGAIAAQAEPNGHESAGTPAGTPFSVAMKVAQYEADTTTPDSPSSPSASATAAVAAGRWPANVSGGSYSLTDRANTASLVGLSTTTDDRPVVVVQMTGNFAVETTAPTAPAGSAAPISVVTGQNEVVVADAGTGQILDFSLSNNATQLPSAQSLYGSSPSSVPNVGQANANSETKGASDSRLPPACTTIG